MDRPRTDQARRRQKRWIAASAIALAVIGLTVAVARLKPAAPTVASQLESAEAELRSFKVQLESDLLAAESTAAAAKADYEQATLRAQVNEELFKKGLVSELDMRLSKVTAEQAQARNTIERTPNGS